MDESKIQRAIKRLEEYEMKKVRDPPSKHQRWVLEAQQTIRDTLGFLREMKK